jgi:hypothetical protein
VRYGLQGTEGRQRRIYNIIHPKRSLGRTLNEGELMKFRRMWRRLMAADIRFYHSLADDRIRETINHG